MPQSAKRIPRAAAALMWCNSMGGTIWSKFFWSDWLSDTGLRRCSLAARGLWMDMLCFATDCDPPGYLVQSGLPFDSADIARLTGASVQEVAPLLEELERNGVFSRDRHGTIYSRRIVRDVKKHESAVTNGRKGGESNYKKNNVNKNSLGQFTKPPPKPPPSPICQKERTSSESPVTLSSEPKGSGARAPVGDLKADLFSRGRSVLGKQAGGLIAKLVRHFGSEDDPKTIAKARAQIEEASTKTRPDEWIGRIISGKSGDGPVDWRSVL